MPPSPNLSSPSTLLSPITSSPKGLHYTTLRTTHIATLLSWRKKYALVVQFPEWKPILKPLAKPLSKLKENRLESLLHERNRLLMKTDRLAGEMSRDCGWRVAVDMCGVARGLLATEGEEVGEMLRLWVEPGVESLQNRIRKLMDIRFVLAVLTVVEDFCSTSSDDEQESGASGIGGDEREDFGAWDWEVPRKQASDLIDRLAWCPPMHRHFDELSKEHSEYSVLSMATRDAKRVKKWLSEVKEGSSGNVGGKGKGKAKEIERFKPRPAKIAYMKAWIIAVIAELVNLPLTATVAQSFVDMIEEGALCGIDDVIEGTSVKKEAIDGLQKHIDMEYRYSDFWHGLPEELAEAAPVKFDQAYADQIGTELGYGNVHEGMDPDDLAMLL